MITFAAGVVTGLAVGVIGTAIYIFSRIKPFG